MADEAIGDGKGILTGDGPLGMRGWPGVIANAGMVGVILSLFVWQQRDIASSAAADRQAAREAASRQWEVIREAQNTTERLSKAVSENQSSIKDQTDAIKLLTQQIRDLVNRPK